MSVQVETLEKSMAKLTVEVSAEKFDKAVESVYQKNKNKFNVPGFRKGKTPKSMIEKLYGAGVFYEDAANMLLPDAYADAVEESGLDVVSRPEIDIEQIGEGKPMIFTATVAVKPEVTLGEYKGIAVEKEAVEVTDEDVMEALKAEQKKNATLEVVTDRAVQEGDTAIIDFEGFVDGVAFEGGKGEAYPLVIGSGQFIPGFEEQLIGASTGDSIDVNVTFPEQYQAENLAGKPALFKVKVNEIKCEVLPEIDDDFASDVSEFDTLDEYKESLAKELADKKEEAAKTAREDAIVDKLVEGMTVEIPQAMIDTQADNMVEDFAMNLRSQGLSIEQYTQMLSTTREGLAEQMKPQAEKRIKVRLALEAVAKAENIEATEDEFKAEIDKMADMYKMEAEKILEYLGEAEKEQIKKDIAVQKAVDFIVENAVEA
ncbi:MAG: trigger factor [Lachnospiraceae bacterium]|nr:trigger factor [Lachnospiraceae bacterium]